MNKPSFYLNPPITLPAFPPTWADVEQLARDYPTARHAVVMVQRGDWTREQALIMLAFAFASAYQQMFAAEIERLNTELPSRFMLTHEFY